MRAILRQDGQPYSIMLVSEYQFQGQSLGVGASGVPFGLHDGMSVRVIGVAAPPLDLRPYVWYVRGSRDWEPVSYRSFFDLTHDTPDPAILALYPENAVLWLYGPAERVTPYLIPPERVGFAPDPGEVALVRGRLQSADPPRILFDEIYLLNGECQPPILPDQRQWPCTTWEEVYPGYFPIQFQARVRRVDAERGIVVFEEPVRGFITLTVNPDLPVGGENGAQTPLSDLTRGTLIAVTGIPGEAGAIVGGCLATQALAP